MEVSRKHGPFDIRWPRVGEDRSTPARTPAFDPAEVAEALDWDAFSTRYFPGPSRHNAHARSAYAAYKQGREWRKTAERPTSAPTERVRTAVALEREEAGIGRLLEAMAAPHPREALSGLRADQI